jgi:hypothetical protein
MVSLYHLTIVWLRGTNVVVADEDVAETSVAKNRELKGFGGFPTGSKTSPPTVIFVQSTGLTSCSPTIWFQTLWY